MGIKSVKPRLLLSWSGGKDSAWCLHELRRDGRGEVAGLLVTVNERFGRTTLHAVRQGLMEAQAEALELPLWKVPLPYPCSNEQYEAAMREAVRRARAEGFSAVAFGDLFLEDVRRYREDRLAGTGLEALFPLWGRSTAELAREMIDGGLRARLTCVDPRYLPPSFAGREFDASLLADLPAGVDPCGERGEFHTFVYAGPMFRHPLAVRQGEVVERDGLVFADFLEEA